MPKKVLGKTNYSDRSSSNHYRWKIGGRLTSTGYVKIRVGKKHPLADSNGYAYEHHVVWWSAIGATNLNPGTDAKNGKRKMFHHLNHNKTDNRIENLGVVTKAEHNTIHFLGRKRDGKGKLIRFERIPDGSNK